MEESPVLPAALEPFYDEGLIMGVLRIVKSGKEATVYCCEAHPSTRAELLAAKIYRPRESRSFQNDAIYREGRYIRERRLRLAFAKKTRKGREYQFGSWLSQEFQTLRQLHEVGADVPRAIALSDGAILMEYLGDDDSPAPQLIHVQLAPHEARQIFDVVLHNIELWLRCNVIHADLSPFNILYWQGQIKIIDFPQAIDPRFNPNAFSLLTRDVENVCGYWKRYGIQADPQRIARRLWTRFVDGDL